MAMVRPDCLACTDDNLAVVAEGGDAMIVDPNRSERTPARKRLYNPERSLLVGDEQFGRHTKRHCQ